MGHRRTTTPIGALDAHPNETEIRGILSRLPCISDGDLPLLARAWHNTTLLAEARRRSLEPDSPLVIEILSWFDTVQALFAEEIRGDADYLTVDPEVTSWALKAVRDAIAAAYARPILTATEHNALMKAWRSVYPTDHVCDPDLGKRAAEVASLLVAMPRLASRCHDAGAAAEYTAILHAAAGLDEDVRCAARDEAWHAGSPHLASPGLATGTPQRRREPQPLLRDLPATSARRRHRPGPDPVRRCRLRPAGRWCLGRRDRRRSGRARAVPDPGTAASSRGLTTATSRASRKMPG